jgi:DNA modification methylase
MNIHCKYDELVEVGKLKAHPKNRNKHPEDQIERLAKILKYQGLRAPIVVSNRSGKIVKGHGTLQAIKKNGWDKAPVVRQDFEDEDQEWLFLQSDNAIAMWAELDLKEINFDLSELGPFDIDLLGIKDFTVTPEEKPYGDEEAVPEIRQTDIQLGDLFVLGNHRLLCGDSTEAAQVERLMNGEKADFLYNDPPYGMNLNTNYAKNNLVVGKTYKKVINDDKEFNPTFYLELFKDVKEQFWWGADYYCQHLPKNGSWIVWDKKKEVLDESIGTGFELCWSKLPHKRMLARFLWSGFTAKEKKESRVHPTQKPIALHEWFFSRWGKSNDKVVDLFGGSGSTLIACEKTNRKCFMMELDPQYCQVIIDRWEKYTGKKAVKHGSTEKAN